MNRALTPYVVSNAEAELAELLPEVLEGAPVFKDYLEVCTLWRQVAIGSFLLSNDPAPLFENLSKSVHAFLHGLEVLPAEEILTSGFLPFFDALACRNEDAIRRMTAAAPR